MRVTVTERTKEIWLMKSLGFTSMDVLSLFVVESAIGGQNRHWKMPRNQKT
ncbi:MAG: ABC transporter permease [Methanosarcinales archaeon]|nr:MAG: ABC transporter permease [Methanosarcinales archaeon]